MFHDDQISSSLISAEVWGAVKEGDHGSCMILPLPFLLHSSVLTSVMEGSREIQQNTDQGILPEFWLFFVCRKANIQCQSKNPSPAALECSDQDLGLQKKPPASPFWGQVKPLDDSSTYSRKIRHNSQFCLQQGRILQMFLTYNAGGAGYRRELVISAGKRFASISFFSPGFPSEK